MLVLMIILSINVVYGVGRNITVYENYDIVDTTSGPHSVKNICECKVMCLINTKEGDCTIFSVSGPSGGNNQCFLGVTLTPEYQMVPATGKTTFLIQKRFFLTEEKYATMDIQNDYKSICADYHAQPGYIFDTEEYHTMRRDVLPYQDYGYFYIPIVRLSPANRIWVGIGVTINLSGHILSEFRSVEHVKTAECNYLKGTRDGYFYFLGQSCSNGQPGRKVLCRYW